MHNSDSDSGGLKIALIDSSKLIAESIRLVLPEDEFNRVMREISEGKRPYIQPIHWEGIFGNSYIGLPEDMPVGIKLAVIKRIWQGLGEPIEWSAVNEVLALAEFTLGVFG